MGELGRGQGSTNPEGQSGDEAAESDDESAFRNQFFSGFIRKASEGFLLSLNQAAAFKAALKPFSQSEPLEKPSGHVVSSHSCLTHECQLDGRKAHTSVNQ